MTQPARFSNPPASPHPATRHRPFAILRWMLTRTIDWPHWIDDPKLPPPLRAPRDGLSVTFINHATFLIQCGGVAILTDPIFSRRASPIPFAGPARIRAPGQPIDALPAVDLVLVSHCHYDHLDLASLRRIRRRFRPAIAAPLGHAELLRRAGFDACTELDWWGSAEPIPGIRLIAIPARHFSARSLRDRNRRLWAGFVIEAGSRRICFLGDTGAGPHLAEIGRRLGPFDLALIPIGAYSPRALMAEVHIDPEEAVAAHLALRATRSLGMHFGTFRGLTDEPLLEPEQRLRDATRAAGLPDDAFTTLRFGQTIGPA